MSGRADSLASLFEQVRKTGLKSAKGRVAAEAIVRSFGDQVLALSRRKATPQEVNDVFQEAFLQLFLQAQRGAIPRSPGGYLAAVVRRVAHDPARLRARRGVPTETEELVKLVDDDVADQDAGERELVAQIDLLWNLHHLPPRMRRVIEATIHDEAPESVAAELGLTQANLRQLRHRALRLIRDFQENIPSKLEFNK